MLQVQALQRFAPRHSGLLLMEEVGRYFILLFAGFRHTRWCRISSINSMAMVRNRLLLLLTLRTYIKPTYRDAKRK